MKKILYSSLVLSQLACGGAQEKSSLDWAQFNFDSNYGSITARVNYLLRGSDVDFESVKVCIQGSESYRGDSLLLETKLAYASWLSASDELNEELWSKLEFELRDSCSKNDASFGSAVIIASESVDDSSQRPQSFNQVECTPSQLSPGYYRFPSFDCNSYGQVLGLGGPGGIARYGTQFFRSVGPSTALLTPYVEWSSLAEEFDFRKRAITASASDLRQLRMDGYSEDKTLDEVSLDQLSTKYNELQSKAKTISYQELVEFSKMLKEVDFESSNNLSYVENPFNRSTYRPKKTALHTLLHEVGHQFGMAHADNPSFSDETGESSKAKQGADGRWTCDEASMAYGNSYTFLTDDDQKGLKNLWDRFKKLLNP